MVNALVSKAGKTISFAGSNPAIRNIYIYIYMYKTVCYYLSLKGL